jgi:hypothetical protein
MQLGFEVQGAERALDFTQVDRSRSIRPISTFALSTATGSASMSPRH